MALSKMPSSPFVLEDGQLAPEWRHYLANLAVALTTNAETPQTAAAIAASAVALFAQAVENSAVLEARVDVMQTGAGYCVGSTAVMTHSDDDVTYTHGFTDLFGRANGWREFRGGLSSGLSGDFLAHVPIVDAVSYHDGTQVDSIDATGMASPLYPYVYVARALNDVDRL